MQSLLIIADKFSKVKTTADTKSLCGVLHKTIYEVHSKQIIHDIEFDNLKIIWKSALMAEPDLICLAIRQLVTIAKLKD